MAVGCTSPKRSSATVSTSPCTAKWFPELCAWRPNTAWLAAPADFRRPWGVLVWTPRSGAGYGSAPINCRQLEVGEGRHTVPLRRPAASDAPTTFSLVDHLQPPVRELPSGGRLKWPPRRASWRRRPDARPAHLVGRRSLPRYATSARIHDSSRSGGYRRSRDVDHWLGLGGVWYSRLLGLDPC